MISKCINAQSCLNALQYHTRVDNDLSNPIALVSFEARWLSKTFRHQGKKKPWVSHGSNLMVSKYMKKFCDLETKFGILGVGHDLLAAARMYEYSR